MLGHDKFFTVQSFVLCFCIGFHLVHVAISQVPLGSKLSVEDNKTWVSTNGNFAVGFFNHSDQPNEYSVGICFNSESIAASKQTVVWVVGADITVGEKSYFQLSQKGELVLVDSLKGVVWTSNTSQLAVVSALLRGDGNLILLNGKNDVVWQSFDYPTDTLLPGQSLSVHQTLRAGSKNSISSYYSLIMNASGELQLKWESNVIYWTSGNPSTSNVSAMLSSGGVLQIVNQNLEPVWSISGGDHDDGIDFRLLRLDVDGNLRMYSWVKDAELWRSAWQAVEDQCKVFATCGQQGICAFNASGSPQCQCPFKSISDLNSKCFAQDCMCGFSMVRYEHTFLYQIYPPNDSINHTSLEQCRSLCLQDPTCTAVTYTNDGTAQCRMKTTPYYSGYSDPSLSSISFVKKCSDPLAVDPNWEKSFAAQSPVKQSPKLCFPCLIAVASCTCIVFIVVQLGFCFFICRRRSLIQKKVALAYKGHNSKGLMILSFDEIKDITRNFEHRIGPKMYRGMLADHQPVAIKEMETRVGEKKFRAVVSKIGSIHHKNLVKLHGYCCDFGHRFLVYEYFKYGSVEKYIEDEELSKRLTWRRRIDICLSVARAICYLHMECREFISHGNLKCENVILEKNLDAKVSEFGLGLLYCQASVGGEKDVEDFGKMVLMLVTGSLVIYDGCEWIYKEWFEGHPERLVDRRIDNGVDIQELERVLRIAFWCLQIDERTRPSMGEVVKVLEGTLVVDSPPPPFNCWSLPREGESP